MNKERKYTSKQKHEQSYKPKRKSDVVSYKKHEKGGEVKSYAKILIISSKSPLSTQIEKETGDTWNSVDYTDRQIGNFSIATHKKSDKKFIIYSESIYRQLPKEAIADDVSYLKNMENIEVVKSFEKGGEISAEEAELLEYIQLAEEVLEDNELSDSKRADYQAKLTEMKADLAKLQSKEEPKKAEKKEVKKSKSESTIVTDAKFDIREKDGAILVGSKYNTDWVITIEPKGKMFRVSCCDDEAKHDDQPSKQQAIAYAKDWLTCRELFDKAHKNAAKRKASKGHDKKVASSVSATTEQAADAVENKVEKKLSAGENVSPQDRKDAKTDIQRIVEAIKAGTKTEAERKKFIQDLINELKKML